MPRQHTNSAGSNPSSFFVKELVDETPPSFSTMERLYKLASILYTLRPWHLLDENELVLVRDSGTGATCFCSVMGRLGEVLAMHAYIGSESYRLFRRIASGEIAGPGEFFESQQSVYVEFVPREDLEAQDKKLLAAMGHPLRKADVAPVFRAIRPRYHPWYVTEQEARTLAECISAVTAICSLAGSEPDLNYWDRDNIYPVVSQMEGEHAEPQYRVELEEVAVPSGPTLSLGRVEEHLRRLRNQDYALRGVIELDYFLSGAMIGKKNERKAFVRAALAVDANSGIVFPPELAPPEISTGDMLAMALIKAVEAGRALPTIVRVQDQRFKDCLEPISKTCGFSIKVVRSLPALESARASLLSMMEGSGFSGSGQ
jgi:hypothetical protein